MMSWCQVTVAEALLTLAQFVALLLVAWGMDVRLWQRWDRKRHKLQQIEQFNKHKGGAADGQGNEVRGREAWGSLGHRVQGGHWAVNMPLSN
jgi:hypothetical protein